ncbi:MAG: YkgJ family cysteine cluster protein [Phycisphaerae bacterium]|nr:YkgJ family cysteine cluster protein [Phycisphaerae bacterium]
MGGMETDPRVVARLAAKREDENWAFRTFLKASCGLSRARLNALARRFGDQAAAQINCLACGACCRDIVVPLTDGEITAMAAAVGLSEPVFTERYVRPIDEHPKAIDAKPCPFQTGTRCTIYEHRPVPCRGYPYIGSDVYEHSIAILERAEICPIAFEMLEQLKTHLGFRRWR